MASDRNMVAVYEDQESHHRDEIDWGHDGPDLSDDEVFAAWLSRPRGVG